MAKYVCSVCGYVYDEAAGAPEQGIAFGTKWEDLPPEWSCPLCGATKDEFEQQTAAKKPATAVVRKTEEHEEELRELSIGELSALCSNLSRGCEKQFRPREAELFSQLAGYYQSKCGTPEPGDFSKLAARIDRELKTGYPEANGIAAAAGDRGALRALVWTEKVTRILASLLSRYEKQKEALLENTSVYVCDICGFVYIGDEPPEVCPVCKVPRFKISKIKKEAV